MHTLFSYGTLQDEQIQHACFGRTLQGAHDQLAGYALGEIMLDAKAFPIIHATGSGSHLVEGTVFTLTDAELAAADRYEGSDYVRIEVRLASGQSAWVYAAHSP